LTTSLDPQLRQHISGPDDDPLDPEPELPDAGSSWFGGAAVAAALGHAWQPPAFALTVAPSSSSSSSSSTRRITAPVPAPATFVGEACDDRKDSCRAPSPTPPAPSPLLLLLPPPAVASDSPFSSDAAAAAAVAMAAARSRITRSA